MPETLRLLIVDDDARTRHALAACLATREGMTVSAQAANGEEAIESIEAQPPDVVLLDVRMPVMGGIEAAQMIRKRWPQVKVIILTMYPDARFQVHAIGVDAFVLKGGSLEDLVDTIRSVGAP
jgi:DNA-binding NarL/FixJ family response regulator